MRVIHQRQNQGKAVGLNTAALLTHAEILVGIDGDARLDPYALHWLVRHFDDPEVAAVTGNPRVRNRSTLLGRIQVGEFSSIVGLIKRAQRSVGLIFTVSGVIAAFRRSALHEVGYWSPEKLTEDVDISLETAAGRVGRPLRAACPVLDPDAGNPERPVEAAAALVDGRQPGAARLLRRKCCHRRTPDCGRYASNTRMSITWACLFALLAVYRVIDLVFYRIDLQSAPILMLGWAGLLIGTTCLLQIMLSLVLDRPYDRGLLKNYFWMIWYPIIYWVITAATSVVALPKILFRDSEKRARWTSPDRGIKPDASR